jgi:superfamily II DNA helicase RecQ
VGTAGPPPPPGEAARLDALRDWRRRTAAEEGRAEALVLSDATLEELAARRPATLDALRDVWGIGPVKSQRYGEALLELSRRG